MAGCALCRAVLDDLRGAQMRVSADLAALPAIPVPADIADRLHAALAAEARSEAPSSGAATVTPFPAAAPGAGPAKWLAAAAAVVVLLAGGLYGLSQLRGDSDGATSTSSDAGGAAAAKPELALARNSSGTDYTGRDTLAAAVPDLLGGRRQAADSAMVQGAPAPSAQKGANTLAVPAAEPLARLRTDEGLAECLLALLPPDDPSAQPLAVDYASFRGQPAMVVVLPAATAGKLDVFVVGPACSRANDSVLFYTSVDKP